jgi:hypothetical protein
MAADVIMQGATLHVNAAGGAPTDLINNMVSMSGPSSSRTVIQIGDANSTLSANTTRAGRVTHGAWNFTFNLDPAVLIAPSGVGLAYGNMQIVSATINATPYNWKVTTIDGTTFIFTGFVSAFTTDGADDGNITASFTVTMQSKITIA